MASVADIQDVSKLFGRFAALRHVSATLDAGGCYLLLGENGAGKSTLLRVLAGLLRPTLGTVMVLGRAATESRGRLGYMSHASMLYDELTARENLEYTARLYAGQACLSPDDALRMVGLDPELARPVAQYSQGMRQRTSLARVLLSQPELLLLDEPFSNMDRASAERMLALLADLRCAGRTIVLTTHQRELAEPMADVVMTMHGGALASVEAR
ncbi:MAG TPA: heme ABC exporter ATP-binding protein CcmA [Acidobacteriaceae bacterium]